MCFEVKIRFVDCLATVLAVLILTGHFNTRANLSDLVAAQGAVRNVSINSSRT